MQIFQLIAFFIASTLCAVSASARALDTSITTNLAKYLVGNWCLNQEETMGDLSYNGEVWKFTSDGKYTFNGLGEDPYSIKEDQVKMVNFGTITVLEISESKMIAKIHSTYYFSKDRCSDDTLQAIKLTQVNNAILRNKFQKVKALIEAGVDISKADTRSFNQSTPLILAVREENIEIIKLLLKQKPDLSITNYLGKTAKDFAKRSKSSEIKELLENAY